MGATGLLARRVFRRDWRSLAALTLLTAAACGFALTAVMGARRTHTSWPRLEASTLAAQAGVDVPAAKIDAAAMTVAASRDVAASGAFSYFPASVVGMPDADQHGLFAGLGPGFGTSVFRPLVEQGRLADPGRADEITVNREYARLAGVHVGDRVRLTGPVGIDQRVTVVGIHRSPLEIGPNGGEPSALATPAFAARWWPALADVPGFEQLRPAIAIRFRPGTDAGAALRRLARDLPRETGIIPPGGFGSDVAGGLRAATTAYLILAGTSAAGAVLVLWLLFARSMRGRRTESGLLAALGATRRNRAVALSVPHAAAVALGVMIAPFLAALASPLVRTGFAALADPVVGIWVDVPVLLASTASLAVALLAAAAVSAWRAAGLASERDDLPMRPSRFEWLRHASPSANIGVPAALGGIGSSSRRASRATLLAIAFSMACMVGALVWVSSAHQLVNDAALQGWNFDAVAMRAGGASSEAVQASGHALRARREVAQLVAYQQATVSIRGNEVDVIALADVHGAYSPVITRGRPPSGPNQIAISSEVARVGGLGVGDRLVLPGQNGNVTTTIVGEVVFPFLGITSFGDAILMTDETFAAVVAEPLNSGYLVHLRAGADLDRFGRALGEGFTLVRPSSPPQIVRLHDATGIAAALAGFFALLAAGVFLFAIVAGTYRRRREYAIARAVGFDRGQVRAACRWHAGVVLLVCAVVAVPAGIIIGRTAWHLSSDHLAVLHRASVPFATLAVTALGAALFGLLVAALVGRAAARTAVADALRAE